jgi:hypothetical protein
VYPAVAENPATLLGKLDNGTLGLEEEEVLGVGNGEGRVGLLRAVCDFTTDGANENLKQIAG